MTNLCCKEHDVFWQYSTSEFSHCRRNKGSKVVETKMSNVRETSQSFSCIRYSKQVYQQTTEFALLYDVHKSTNSEFPSWNFEKFYLDEKKNTECMAEFRFYGGGIYELAEPMQLLDERAI